MKRLCLASNSGAARQDARLSPSRDWLAALQLGHYKQRFE
jgi:hypothetical protein